MSFNFNTGEGVGSRLHSANNLQTLLGAKSLSLIKNPVIGNERGVFILLCI